MRYRSRLEVRSFGASLLWAAVAAAVLNFACSSPSAETTAGTPAEPDRQPRYDLTEALRADQAADRSPADGGGRAWVEPWQSGASTTFVASRPGRWRLVYEAGPLGVAVGGTVFLQVSPFWGWSTPQTERPDAPGYSEITTTATGVELAAATLDQQLLGITIGGRPLVVGEQIEIFYGAGPQGARTDRFAERGSRFWLAVDGDGDGVRGLLQNSPTVEVVAGNPRRLLLTLPSTGRPGEPLRLTIALLDELGNAGLAVAAEIQLSGAPASLEVPSTVRLEPADGGTKTLELVPREPGLVRIEATSDWGLSAVSNPLQVSAAGQRVLWADLQNHSNFSDGTALPEDFFRYARDVAALDVVALTDHDHWGLPFLDQSPSMWAEILAQGASFDQPGRFVTLPGFEWTSWIHGHRHVLFFDGRPEIFSSLSEATDTPQELWAALDGRRALTIAHHSAGGPIAVDWSIAPDPRFEPVTEIVSVHGSSEAADSPRLIYRPVAGNFVRDALARGYRLGFLGSSDGHDGHPGLGHLAAPSGGLAAILADELTRDSIYEALIARRTYATSGPRILMRVSLAGWQIGAEVPVAKLVAGETGPLPGIPPKTLVTQVFADGELDRVELIGGGEIVSQVPCDGQSRCTFAVEISEPEVGDYLYLRALQLDGHAAWTSPFYFVD